MSIMMTMSTIGNIAQPISAASRAARAARILFNGIDAPKPKTTGKKAPEVSATERIVLWNVNFTYPSRPKEKILDQFKLVIPAGKVTAIVGPSGSGKSTIVSLIERWYELDGAATGNKLVCVQSWRYEWGNESMLICWTGTILPKRQCQMRRCSTA